MRNFLLLFPLLWLCGCSGVFTSPPSQGQAEADFKKVSGDYLAGYLVARPQLGTALGLHEYDGMLSDFSQPALDQELRRLKTYDQRLAVVATNQLTPGSSYDYRILRNSLQRELFGFEDARIYARNPMTYAGAIDINIYIKRNFAPLEDRVASITSILNQAPNVFAAARANLVDVLPRPWVETAIEQANGAADFLAKDLVAAVRPVKNEGVRDALNGANRRAIYELRQYAAWLKEKKLPAADDNYALGRSNYMKLLACGEMVTLPPEQLLDIGMHELKRQQTAFAEAAHEIDQFKTPLEVFKQIQQDHPTEEALIPDTARHLEMIRQFVVKHDLVTIPSPVRASVAETPEYMRATSFASMDTPGPFETRATEAYYYVTPPESFWSDQQKNEWLTAFNYYTTDIVSIHEAYPGHYVQFLCLNASAATPIEKIFAGYAFTEGWAHYAEQMMVDEGFGEEAAAFPEQAAKGAKYRMAQADEALLRVCRFCVSIKMHCQGMTIEEATRFFEDNCYYEAKPARQEAIRGSFDPEYLYYTLGKLEIQKLRNDYARQEGTAFSLRRFHDEMLRHGAPPIRLLREIMLHDSGIWDDIL